MPSAEDEGVKHTPDGFGIFVEKARADVDNGWRFHNNYVNPNPKLPEPGEAGPKTYLSDQQKNWIWQQWVRFLEERLVTLEQRVTDLELLAAQPQGAVKFLNLDAIREHVGDESVD